MNNIERELLRNQQAIMRAFMAPEGFEAIVHARVLTDRIAATAKILDAEVARKKKRGRLLAAMYGSPLGAGDI